MAKLTAAGVEKIKAIDRRQEIPDSLVTGLYLVVQPSGRKAWQVRYRTGVTHRRMSLGPFPLLSLSDARERARDVLLKSRAGADPAGEIKRAKASKIDLAARDTIKALVDLHNKRHLSKLRSGNVVWRELDRHVVTRWGDRDVHSITKRDVVDLLDEIMDSGREITANRLRGYLSKFFNWCIERDILTTSPMQGVRKPAKEISRERFLTDDEIRWFWNACESVGWPWEAAGKLLLLTGQRLGEVVGMAESEVEGSLWMMGGERTKNGRAHTVPLSEISLKVLASHGRTGGGSGLIFTTTGIKPLSGFHKARAKLAGAMNEIASNERGMTVQIPHWTFHDLRRTAATGMARIGQPTHVVEAVLNHVSGAISGVAGVYNRHSYDSEKSTAMEAWGRHVLSLVRKTSEAWNAPSEWPGLIVSA
ncbi:tyrosine-type recombinase/integrase [Albidovulum sediminicola]|uniref:Site-specific integrase n=1 Tax=Albidovulum sediminicola TaxID=2984331 RepID=A0ABT2Z726_9RHOB|nr:site-specific integrase [Defluviimonas sp. WL0075]MCV2866939.1 site-specific integrase [Defluviimonas sp. WL0075]